MTYVAFTSCRPASVEKATDVRTCRKYSFKYDQNMDNETPVSLHRLEMSLSVALWFDFSQYCPMIKKTRVGPWVVCRDVSKCLEYVR